MIKHTSGIAKDFKVEKLIHQIVLGVVTKREKNWGGGGYLIEI